MSKKDEFKQRVRENPLVTNGLNKIQDEQQRKLVEAEIEASCEELGKVFETLSNALEDPEILKQVLEEFRKQNDLVNGKDQRNTKK